MARLDSEYFKGQQAAQRGKLDEAFRLLEISFHKYGNKPAAFNLAALSHNRQDYKGAQKYYFAALQNTPGYPLPDDQHNIALDAIRDLVRSGDADFPPEHIDFLKGVTETGDLVKQAIAAFTLGLYHYDLGGANRAIAAKFYRKAARLGDTGSKVGNRMVADANANLRELSLDNQARAADIEGRLKHVYGQSENSTVSFQVPPAGQTVPLPTCGNCGRTDVSINKKCGRCKKVYFCDQACQVANWKDHKRVCCAA